MRDHAIYPRNKEEQTTVILTKADLRKVIREELTAGITYSREQAARKLKVSLPTLDRMIETGVLKGSTFGKRTLISERAIQMFHEHGGQKI